MTAREPRRRGPRRARAGLVACLAVLCLVSGLDAAVPAAAVDPGTASLRARQRAAAAELAEAQEGLADTGEAAARAAEALAGARTRQGEAQAALEVATTAARTARDTDVALAGRLAAAEESERVADAELEAGRVEVAEAAGDLARVVSAAYRSGGADPTLSLVVGGGAAELSDRVASVQTAVRVRSASTARLRQQQAVQAHRSDRLEAVRVQVAALRQEAAEHRAATEAAEAGARARRDELDAAEAAAEAAVADLEAQRARYEQQAADAQAESDGIAAELRARERERARRAASSGGSGSGGSGGSGSGGGAAPSRGVLGDPLAAMTVTSSFGYRVHPVYHVRRLHAGTDLRAACGTPVYAAADGEVVRAGPGTGYGNILVVDHGTVAGRSVATAYAHLSRFDVRVGQSVRRGQLVAHSGSTGVGTACHLHFEVRVGGSPVDATAWL